MRQADLPEEMVQPVGHEPERRHFLLSCNLCHVLAELLFALARVARRALGFDDGEHAAVGVVEAKIGEAVPRRRVVALDGNLKLDLRAVAEVPARFFQLRIYERRTGLCFIEIRHRYSSAQ